MLSIRIQRRLFLFLGIVSVLAVGRSAWLQAQQLGQFGPFVTEPTYVVVNTATPVLFTAQITDPQLKERSVVLVRLDPSGQPSDILGRMRDDGSNGDSMAGDSTYSLRLTLKEPAIGVSAFAAAARFKPRRGREGEPDDDEDWDRELSMFLETVRQRDFPAQRQLLHRLLDKLGRYEFSAPATIDIWGQVSDSTLGVSFAYPSDWKIQRSLGGDGFVVSTTPPEPPSFNEGMFGFCKIGFVSFNRAAGTTIAQWLAPYNDSPFPRLVSSNPSTVNGMSAVRQVAIEEARTDTVYLSPSSTKVVAAQLLCGADMQAAGTAAFEEIISTIQRF